MLAVIIYISTADARTVAVTDTATAVAVIVALICIHCSRSKTC